MCWNPWRLKIDAFYLTETWHDAKFTCMSKLRQDEFTVLKKAKPRNGTTENTLLTFHGGVAFVVNSRLRVSPINVSFKCHNFEFFSAKVSRGSKSIIGLVVYRTGYASIAFFEEFEKLLNIMATYNEDVFILGDFNFHLESPDDRDAQKFFELLSSHVFESFVNKPTDRQRG